MEFKEFDFIDTLRSNAQPELLKGIGDDAAVFQSKGPWAISTDSLQENVHFRSQDEAYGIGWKIGAVNLSDMAAMGCRPKFFLLNLHLNESFTEQRLNEFMRGLNDVLDRFGVSLIGGDTIVSKARDFSCVGTVLGVPYGNEPIYRTGFRAGDVICVTGEGLGGTFPDHHLRFEPRVEWSEMLCRHTPPSAMMDLSDGLVQDLGHMIKDSGCDAMLELDLLPIRPNIKEQSGRVERALCDGEDFELLFTVTDESLKDIPKGVVYHQIGKMIEGKGVVMGREDENAAYRSLDGLNGYVHKL